MSPSFLNNVNLTDEAREKLRELGAANALALLCMRQASPIAFDAHMGGHAQDIANALFATLSDEEKTFLLSEPPIPEFKLGALLEPRD